MSISPQPSQHWPAMLSSVKFRDVAYDGKPQPPPEAVLIRLARQAGRIKAPAAARAASISVARWSQIENGYERRRGEYKPISGSPATIAHMANAVGLSPGRLEAEGKRPDAAEILTEIQRQRDGRSLTPLGQDLARRRMDLHPTERTWEAAATATGLDPELIEAIETGRRTEFSDSEICDLAHAYQMAESDLRKSLANGELITSDAAQSVSEGEAALRSLRPTDAEWSALNTMLRAMRGLPVQAAPTPAADPRRTA